MRRERIEGTDLLVVRELTGGMYFGEKTRTLDYASDLCAYTTAVIERIARIAFRAARTRVASVDRANVLETSRLWREVVSGLLECEFPHIGFEHVLGRQRRHAARLATPQPLRCDRLRENMFGDILSDEAARDVPVRSALLPSASLGDERSAVLGLYEPSAAAPRPTSPAEASPTPSRKFLSAALMLRHGFSLDGPAAAVESAVERALDAGLRTADLGGDAGTDQALDAVLEHL